MSNLNHVISELFEQDPELMTKPITYWWETPLIITVEANSSNRFVEKLVERIGAEDKLFLTSHGGNKSLHYAAKVGNTTAAKLLVEHNSEMTQVANVYGNTPLKLAALHGNKETLVDGDSRCISGVAGGDLITLTLTAGFYGSPIFGFCPTTI
ncbi:putative ankyrin repeat-containing domain-containing protein [Helianthus annuus]|nr:putative ankyrin repeat-containing domain-containing protein [Helianthus annuus]KAJ0745892.1 putative ankyrin repeat-containing domain-containing protein [Helianthus annuus]KAJ0748877.1 putative ankyrin repeat-containing domain-containing protein [Helianthus annuus]